MTLLKRRSSLPSLMTNLFETDPFFNVDWIGDRFSMTEIPAANIVQRNGEFDIELAVPGMKRDDFHITCENGLLTIKGEKEEENMNEGDDFTRREYNFNSFSRTFNLPESVKSEDVKAKYDNGVLKVIVPKKKEAKAKVVKEIKIS